MFHPYAIVLGLFTLTGLAVVVWAAMNLARSRRALQWPWVEGLIDESKPGSEEEGDPLPRIVFRYQVNGETYRARMAFTGDPAAVADHTPSYLARYPEGAQVQVYYDPADPQRATLEPGARGSDWLVLAFGVGVALFGVVALFFRI